MKKFISILVALSCVSIMAFTSCGDSDSDKKSDKSSVSKRDDDDESVSDKDISKANSASDTVYKAINTALTDLDASGVDVSSYKGWVEFDDGVLSTDIFDSSVKKEFADGIKEYFADFDKTDGSALIYKGACVAVIAGIDDDVWGCYPELEEIDENFYKDHDYDVDFEDVYDELENHLNSEDYWIDR